MDIPPEVINGFNTWLRFFRDLWWEETPVRIHQRDLDPSGAPQWHPEFAKWLFSEPQRGTGYQKQSETDQRLRTTRAFRKLRRKAPREFDVLYLMVARRPPLGLRAVAERLNERAMRRGHEDRYTENDILMLAISGLDKMVRWW